MKKLYKFFWDYGRMGCVEGMFVAEEKEVKNAIGKEVYFGEILGKHSEVAGTLKKEHFEVLDADKSFIAKFEELGCESGYNPLSYLEDEEEYDEDDDYSEDE